MGLPEPGTVEQVVVKASGRGRTSAAAISDALRRAVMQVSGADVAGELSQGPTYELDAVYAKNGKNAETLNIRATSFHDNVVTSFGGRVSKFEVLGERYVDGEAEIDIQAWVPQFRPPMSTRAKVVVSSPRSKQSAFVIDGSSIPALQVADTVRAHVIAALSASGRVDVLERSFDEVIDAELSRISSGQTNRDSRARLGQQLAADFVWVATIERFGVTRTSQELRIGGRRRLESLNGGARMSHQLVNVTTGQVIFADNVDVVGPSVAPTTLGASISVDGTIGTLTEQLATRATNQIASRLFPVVVLNRAGATVVLSQGRSALRSGTVYQVSVLGEPLVDPQTGGSLGFQEWDGGTVLITRVSERVSYGTLLKPGAVPTSFKPGQVQLREQLAAPKTEAGGRTGSRAPTAAKSTSEIEEEVDDDVNFEFGSRAKKSSGARGGRGGGR